MRHLGIRGKTGWIGGLSRVGRLSCRVGHVVGSRQQLWGDVSPGLWRVEQWVRYSVGSAVWSALHLL